ncbi:chitinase A, partial [Vibrio parahaemolyticus VP2007-007]
NWPSKCGSRW